MSCVTLKGTTLIRSKGNLKHTYCKNPTNSNTRKIANYSKTGTVSFYYRVMGPKDADRMTNNIDPDQTASLGSTLFDQA